MPVRETHPLRCEAIHVRRGDFGALRVVRMHVAVAEVIGEDDDNVRLRGEKGGAEGEEKKEALHGFDKLFG